MNRQPTPTTPTQELRGEERERLQVMSAFASHPGTKSSTAATMGLRITVQGESFQAATFDGTPVELSLPAFPEKVDLLKDATAVSACNIIPQ